MSGILEEEHKQSNCPYTKLVVPRGERLLELLLVDEAAPVPIDRLEAPNDLRVRPRRKVPSSAATAPRIGGGGIALSIRRIGGERRRRRGIALGIRRIGGRGIAMGIGRRRRRRRLVVVVRRLRRGGLGGGGVGLRHGRGGGSVGVGGVSIELGHG